MSDIEKASKALIGKKEDYLTSTSIPDTSSYWDECNELHSALNTEARMLEDQAEAHRRKQDDLKRMARDKKDIMKQLKNAGSRVRSHGFDLRNEL